MAFGRLDVYWPNGPIEIYQLEKPIIGIGRQRGNDIVIDTQAISRYHTTLTFKDDQCLIEDLGSVNGTYVDGVRLEPNKPRLLNGGEELQIGDVRAIYHPAAGISDTATVVATQTQVPKVDKPTFRVTLEGAEQSVSPGMHARSQLLIENLGEHTDRYFIEVDGVPKEWVRIESSEIELAPGASAQLTISVKPARSSQSAAGRRPVSVHVRASSRPAQTVSAQMDLQVNFFNAFGMRLEPGPVEMGASFPVHLHNQGNIAIKVSLSGHDPQGAMGFHFEPETLNMQPGQRVTALARIEVHRSRRPRHAANYAFAIVATSHDAAGWHAAVPGRVSVLPATLRRVLPILVGVGVLGVATLVLLLAVVLRPSPPEIVSSLVLDGHADGVARVGDALALSWEVRHASHLQLNVSHNGRLQDPILLTPDAQQYTTAPLANAGQYRFVLVAADGDTRVESTPLLLAVMPLIRHFDAHPRSLLRSVEDRLTVEWETQGATSVRIDGLGDLLCDMTLEFLAPQGPQEFIVCPRTEDPVELRLVAQAEGVADEAGANPVEVQVEKVECHVKDGAIFYPQWQDYAPFPVGADAVVYPQGRDRLDTWMLVTTEYGTPGWLLRDEVHCALDPSRLVVYALSLPPVLTTTPTATQTPTATPTATLTATATATFTATQTFTPSPTASLTATLTQTPTATPTATAITVSTKPPTATGTGR